MPLHPVALPAFHDNYIWAVACAGRALVVDPGDADVVEAWLARGQLQLDHILLTHHHLDHTGGVAALKAARPARVFGPAEGIAGVDTVTGGGEHLDLPPFGRIEVIAVPGHTLGHIAFYLPESGLLFCGDSLFSAGCGRLFEGSPAQLYGSLQALASLPDDTLVCCAHEYTLANLRFAAAVEPDNPDLARREVEARERRARGLPTLPVRLGDERRYNPFLRSEVATVVARATAEAGRPLSPGLQTLAALRAWKDGF